MQYCNFHCVFCCRYFSLQATCPQGFSDKVRFVIEGNICPDGGLQPTCFDLPLRIVLHILERVSVCVLPAFLPSFSWPIFSSPCFSFTFLLFLFSSFSFFFSFFSFCYFLSCLIFSFSFDTFYLSFLLSSFLSSLKVLAPYTIIWRSSFFIFYLKERRRDSVYTNIPIFLPGLPPWIPLLQPSH